MASFSGKIGHFVGSDTISLAEKLELMRQCSRSLLLRHSQGVPVGRLRPSNIFVHQNAGSVEITYLDDKGVNDDHIENADNDDNILPDRFYLAPEQLSSRNCNVILEPDVFSLGLVFCDILGFTHKGIIHNGKQSLGEILNDMASKNLSSWNPIRISVKDTQQDLKLKALLISMLDSQPNTRVTIDTVTSAIEDILGFQRTSEITSPSVSPSSTTGFLSDQLQFSVKKLTVLTFGADEVSVGFGYHGECLVSALTSAGSAGRRSLTLYRLALVTPGGNTFQHLWRKPLPAYMDVTCDKFVSHSGQVVLHSDGGPTGAAGTTAVFSSKFQLEDKYTTEPGAGALRAIFLDDWLLYDSGGGGKHPRGGGRVRVCCMDTMEPLHVVTLQKNYRSPFKTLVTVNPLSGYTAVTCAEMHCLEIFDDKGSSLLFTSLPFSPAAVTSSESFVVLAEWEPATLHIYTWEDGCEVASLGPSELQLLPSERIVQMSPLYDHILLMAVWDEDNCNDQIVAFKINSVVS